MIKTWRQNPQSAKSTRLEHCSFRLTVPIQQCWRFLGQTSSCTHDRRSTVELPACSHLALYHHRQRTTDDAYSFSRNMKLMAKATHVRCKTCFCTVAKPSAEAGYFLAIHVHALTTDDRRWNSERSRTYHSLKEWLTIHTAPVLTRKHDTDGNRHLPPLQTLLLHRRQPLCKWKNSLHCESDPGQDLERTSCTQNAVRWPPVFGSYVPTASALEEELLTRNPSTMMMEASSQNWFLCWQRVKTAKEKC